MMRFAFLLAAAILAGSCLAAEVSLAQSAPGTTGAIDPIPLPESATDFPRQMQAGLVTAELTATSPGGRYSPGTSAFAQLKLSGGSDARRALAAELVLEPEFGEIVAVTGSDVDAKQSGEAFLARIGGLRKGRNRTVLIEYKLRAAAGNPPNRLRLTLRAPGAGDAAQQETVAIAWPITDCAGGYHAALKEIGANGGNTLLQSWREASRPDKTMPRSWLFRPAQPARRSNRRGAEPESDGISSKTRREVYLEASRLVSAGYDSSLRQSGQYGWIISKVSGDLKQYFTQDFNPAICTGAIGFTEYYEKQLGPLRKRGDRLTALAADAKLIAREKADKLFEAARNLPGGHPAWGGATLAALKPASAAADDFKALIADLLHVADYPAEAVAGTRSAPDAYAALRVLDDVGLRAGELPASARDDLRDAVASIETAIRLDLVQARHESLWQGLHGSLEAIRDAHAKSCVCGS